MGHNYNNISLHSFLHAQERGKTIYNKPAVLLFLRWRQSMTTMQSPEERQRTLKRVFVSSHCGLAKKLATFGIEIWSPWFSPVFLVKMGKNKNTKNKKPQPAPLKDEAKIVELPDSSDEESKTVKPRLTKSEFSY